MSLPIKQRGVPTGLARLEPEYAVATEAVSSSGEADEISIRD